MKILEFKDVTFEDENLGDNDCDFWTSKVTFGKVFAVGSGYTLRNARNRALSSLNEKRSKEVLNHRMAQVASNEVNPIDSYLSLSPEEREELSSY